MLKVWKRNAVVATVILFVCVAVYLNWSYSDDQSVRTGGGPEASDGYSPGSAELQIVPKNEVGAGIVREADTGALSVLPETGDAAEAEAGVTDDYFSAARLSRQKARDQALQLLNETSSAADVTKEIKDSVSKEISSMALNAVRETQIESLVVAKGFEDCVAFINESGVNVIVAEPEGGLNSKDVAKIKDIAKGETGLESSKIKVVGN